jgi:hypothetical protein
VEKAKKKIVKPKSLLKKNKIKKLRPSLIKRFGKITAD